MAWRATGACGRRRRRRPLSQRCPPAWASPGEDETVRALIDACDDSVCPAFQFIVEARSSNRPQHWLVGLVAVKREACDVRLAVRRAHRSVHRFNDVAADAEIAQGWLKARLQCPLRRTNLSRQAEPLEPGGAAHHQAAKLGVFDGAAAAKIGNPATLVRDIAERAIQTGPTLGVDLLLQPSADLQFATRPQFQCDPLRCAAAKTVADVARLMTRSCPSPARPRTSTWMWGLSVFQ
jgi:hypothetical protein